jgi:hypothetical protein
MLRGRQAGRVVADQDRQPGDCRRDRAAAARPARRRAAAGRHRRVLNRSGGAARAARSLRPLLQRRSRSHRRAGCAHRRPDPLRQPARGRSGPHRQRFGGVHALWRAGHSRRLRYVDKLRCRQREGRVPRRGAGPRHRDLRRRPCRPGRPAAEGRAGAAAIGDRQVDRRGAAVGNHLRVRRPDRRDRPPDCGRTGRGPGRHRDRWARAAGARGEPDHHRARAGPDADRPPSGVRAQRRATSGPTERGSAWRLS